MATKKYKPKWVTHYYAWPKKSGPAPVPPYNFAPVNMTGPNTPAPYVISASTFYGNTTYEPWNAFNGTIASGGSAWLGINNGVDWLKIDLGAGNSKILDSYAVTVMANASGDDCPKNWTMEGSNDNTVWDILDTVTNQINWTAGLRRAYMCDVKTKAYRYFRFNVTANTTGTYTQVGELELFSIYS